MGTFKRAGEIAGDVTAVFGHTKSGRTHQIINAVKARGDNQSVLWVTFGNLNFEGKENPDWITAELPTWKTFETEVDKPLKTGTFKIDDKVITKFDVIVVEGLDIAARFFYDEAMKTRDPKFAQMTYGEIGPVIRAALANLKSKCDALYFSLTTRDNVDQTGTAATKINMNDNAVLLIMPMASNLIYTSSKLVREKTGVVTGINYYVQTSPQLALNFVNGAKA